MVIEHQPPEKLTLSVQDYLCFLAGPIQGARDWQREAIEYISSNPRYSGLHIANPRRDYLDDTFDYEAQTTWEDLGRERASLNGGLIVWLAAQDPGINYEESRLYGQTTRFEFAEAYGWLRYDPTIRIALGIADGYKGSTSYYEHQAKRFRLPIFTTLADVCDFALPGRS